MRFSRVWFVCLLWLMPRTGHPIVTQVNSTRTLSGVVLTTKNQAVNGVSVTVLSSSGPQTMTCDPDGKFQFLVPAGTLTLRVEGKFVVTREVEIRSDDPTEDLRIEVDFVVPPIHNRLVIEATALDPGIDRRNEWIYQSTLFGRDDQLFHTLDAGINAGQHEGGGKSLEIRRYGFNLDHGGVSGGLKVLVDGIQLNQGTQGHGQGYLGQLKSLTPELVQEVNILNGPFSAEYGDFSGLGVVHIRLRESLSDVLTARVQAGSFASRRAFVGYSPVLKKADSFVAYEGSLTDGPFVNPLRYKRHNVTGNYTLHLDENQSVGFKFNAGTNDFFSSGQIPLDEVAAGRLDRFGFLDPDNGGRVRSGTFGAYYRKELPSGGMLKVDGFMARSLFDLYSNFTLFLNDEVNGDEIQQHDSRLQQGANVQFLRPHRFGKSRALFTAGSNFHANQINVGLYHSVGRSPLGVQTRANAVVTNLAGYVQEGVALMGNRINLEAGLRFDHFRFNVTDRVDPLFSGHEGAANFQPKFNLTYRPSDHVPLALYVHYGRGIASQDARGIVQYPSGENVSTTDFYMAGVSHNLKRFSFSADLFLIDRSNEQVYIPDDGSIEFKGPSRAYGFEAKTSLQISRYLALNGGITKITNAFYRGTFPRVYVDSAPHTVVNGGMTLAQWLGFTGSLRLRYINSYRLDGYDPGIRASGFTVVDLSINKRIHPVVDFNLSIDNLTDRIYYETQNYFESRLLPGDPVIARIHGTPGYPIGVTVGLTFHLPGK
jgi:TonB dependent receptor/TonB-dependent Receptor Plug Domain